MMRQRGLPDARMTQVAGAHLTQVAQLAEDGKPGRVRCGLQQQHVGIGLSLHSLDMVLTVPI